jgi:hypothetical protein
MTNKKYFKCIEDKMETIKTRTEEIRKEVSELEVVLDDYAAMQETLKQMLADAKKASGDPVETDNALDSLCTSCKRANVSCPIYPQITQHCVEYRPNVHIETSVQIATVLVPKEETQSFFPPKTCDQGKDMVLLCEPRRECPPFQQCPFDDAQVSDQDKVLVRTLLTIDGKGQEAKRQALTTLLGRMNHMRREAIMYYAETCDRKEVRTATNKCADEGGVP